MAERFSVVTTPRFDRLARTLRKQHKEFIARYREAMTILGGDPYNQSRAHQIKKLAACRTWGGFRHKMW